MKAGEPFARGLIRLCFFPRDRWGTESVSARVGSSQATPSQSEQVKTVERAEQRGSEESGEKKEEENEGKRWD